MVKIIGVWPLYDRYRNAFDASKNDRFRYSDDFSKISIVREEVHWRTRWWKYDDNVIFHHRECGRVKQSRRPPASKVSNDFLVRLPILLNVEGTNDRSRDEAEKNRVLAISRWSSLERSRTRRYEHHLSVRAQTQPQKSLFHFRMKWTNCHRCRDRLAQ